MVVDVLIDAGRKAVYGAISDEPSRVEDADGSDEWSRVEDADGSDEC